MSIPLEDSPFKGTTPCSFAVESNNQIYCVNIGRCCICSDCKDYTPVINFNDNSHSSLRSTWKRLEDETCYWFECSNCGSHPPLDEYKNSYFSPYCPICGHKLYSKDEPILNVDPGFYKHFKGKDYYVYGVAKHTETSECLVVYRALYGNNEIHVRPLNMFTELVEDLSYHYRGPRFFKIEDNSEGFHGSNN